MGKLKQLVLTYDGGVNVFSQGDLIKGEVVLIVDDDKGYGLKDVKGKSVAGKRCHAQLHRRNLYEGFITVILHARTMTLLDLRSMSRLSWGVVTCLGICVLTAI